MRRDPPDPGRDVDSEDTACVRRRTPEPEFRPGESLGGYVVDGCLGEGGGGAGIAKLVEPEHRDGLLTTVGHFLGTPFAMAAWPPMCD
ncbi:MAG: hypothetical protein HY698_12235 [Deltaproteobacteria bacterium]|nr:hypothetical protein [Deltaproteobacteria bacterium]